MKNRYHSVVNDAVNETQPGRWSVIAAFGAIYLIWGTTYLAIRFAVESIPPLTMMGIRCLCAGSFLYAWGLLRGDAGAERAHVASLVLIGTLFFLIGHGLLAWAERTVPSGVAALLIASEPVWVALLEPWYFKEAALGGRTLFGILLGTCGIVLLVLPQGIDVQHANLLGSLGILLGTFAWGFGAIYARSANLPRSPLVTGGAQLLVGGLLLIAASAVTGEWRTWDPTQVTARSWLGLAYLIVFGSIITFSAYTWLLSVTTVTKISTHTFVNPVVAVCVGWLFAGEELTREMIAASLLILVSVYLVLFQRGSSKALPASRERTRSIGEESEIV